MAKIDRYTGNYKPFGANSQGTERTIFEAPGATDAQSDALDANINTDYLRGWGDNVVGPSQHPTRQQFNAGMFTLGQTLAYLHQSGVSEWDSAQEFNAGSVARKGLSLFISQSDANIGNDPESDSINWAQLSTPLFDSVASMAAADLPLGVIVSTAGYYESGDSGACDYLVKPSEVVDGIIDHATAGGKVAVAVSSGQFDIRQAGAKPDASNDCGPIVTAALARFDWVTALGGNYRFDTSFQPVSGKTFSGTKATELRQYGQYLVEQTDGDLEGFIMRDFLLDFRSASSSRYDEAFCLKAHKGCVFENFRFVRYDDQTLITRMPDATASINTIDNVYRDWDISACANIDIGIGLEGYYYRHQGDGATTIINTGVVWPEQFNSSVVVLKENNNRIFSQMQLTTDYSVSYDGSNNLAVTLTAPAVSSERIHIWPAQPRTDGNRRPISNNRWENIRCNYVFIRGHQAIRWVDAELYDFERLTAAQNSVKLYVLNPYDERSGEGGDFMTWRGCVITYQGGVSGSSLTGVDFGPGSAFNVGTAIRGDLVWRYSGDNRLIKSNDQQEVVLDGTVSTTSGSPTVTGLGTSFSDQLTLVGAVDDVVVIDDFKYGVLSIDSDTQITLTSNVGATLSGAPISRYHLSNTVSYDMQFCSSGEGQSNVNSRSIGRYVKNSNSETRGEATIISGNTFVEIPFKLSRTPLISEIFLTAGSVYGNRSVSVSDITFTSGQGSFRINVSSAAAADYLFGWKIDLLDID